MSNPVTLNFQLPLLATNQAQKTVVVNQGLTAIDSLLQLNVLDVGTNTAPSSPSDQDKHIVGTAPTGVWAGQANAVAVYQANGTQWTFYTPKTGWVAYDAGNNTLYAFAGGAWNILAVTFTSGNLGALAGLATVQPLVDIAGIAPANNILIQGNGTHFVGATPQQAVGPTAAMYALIYGG